MLGDETPELIGLLPGCVIHRVLEKLHLQVADAVPVNVNVNAEFCAPIHRLVEQFEIPLWRALAPRNGMNRNAHQRRAHFLYLFKMGFVPMSLMFDFVRVANGNATEQNGLAIGINKPVPLHSYPWKLICQLTFKNRSIRTITPPMMIIVRLRDFLRADLLKQPTMPALTIAL